MILISVDVEADGGCAGLYSMVSFGAVAVRPDFPSFYREVAPISDKWIPEALAVSGFTREQTEGFMPLSEAMRGFDGWLRQFHRPVFISDNNGFDWQFVNHAFHYSEIKNPFGFSSRRIGDLYCGLVKDLRANREWKKLRSTRHSHKAVDDARGNAEALLEMAKMYKIRLD